MVSALLICWVSFIEAGTRLKAGIGIRAESLGIGSGDPAVSQDLERADHAFTLAA